MEAAARAAAERAAAEREEEVERLRRELVENRAAASTSASMLKAAARVQSVPHESQEAQDMPASASDSAPTAAADAALSLSLIGQSGTLGSTSALLQMAQQQAARDAMVTDVRRELDEAYRQISEASEVEAALRRRLRESEMADRRASASVDYVKCLVLQLLRSDDARAADLFPALATCLQFSEEEVAAVSEAREERMSRGGLLGALSRRPAVAAAAAAAVAAAVASRRRRSRRGRAATIATATTAPAAPSEAKRLRGCNSSSSGAKSQMRRRSAR